jgi:hypothetical protein
MFKYVVLTSLLAVCSAIGPEHGCCLSAEKLKAGVSFNISYGIMSDQMSQRLPKGDNISCDEFWTGYQVVDRHGHGIVPATTRHSQVRCWSYGPNHRVKEITYKSITVMGEGEYFAIQYQNGTETCERVHVYNQTGAEDGDVFLFERDYPPCFGKNYSWYSYKGDVLIGSWTAARYAMSGFSSGYAVVDFQNGCIPITLTSTMTAHWQVSNFKFGTPSAQAFDIPDNCKKDKKMVV